MTIRPPSFVIHLVECNCVLPQFAKHHPTIWHKFVVFTELEENGNVKPHYAKCDNCQGIHRIKEIGKPTERVNKETTTLIPNIEDLIGEIPENYGALLKRYNCPLHIWQSVKFYIQHSQWGSVVVLSKEKEPDGKITGKFLVILSEKMFKVENYEQEQ